MMLIGTNRARLPEEEKEKLRSIGIDPDVDEAQTLLDAAAFYAPVMKAGYQPEKWSGDLPETAFIEKQKSCSPRSTRHLNLMLTGRFESALPEFIQLMHQKELCLPPETLPGLLDKCKADLTLWEKIQPIIGERGHWLIAQNPEWQRMEQQQQLPGTDWEGAYPEERVQILEHYRQTAPAKARELLHDSWPTLKTREQAKYLRTFKTGLSTDDEIFLEALLDSRRKEVRTVAAELLQQLPDSALSQRMFDHIVQLMKLKKSKSGKIKLELEPPENLTPALMHDGIGTNKNKGTTRASWLISMLACVPPQRWLDHFEQDVNTVLDLFVRTHWGASCLEGLKQAAAKYHDE
ncbi:MAG: DUF5691 domain-containing protein, partial [Bacteroidota bacterium]